MFFSAEYGVKVTSSDPVEPRFFNTGCSLAVLLKFMEDKVVADLKIEIDQRRKEEKKQLEWLKQLSSSDAGLLREIETETNAREALLTQLDELTAKVGTLNYIDLCYSDSPTAKLNLDRTSNEVAYTALAARSRTFVMGALGESSDLVPLAFEVPKVSRSSQVASLMTN